MGHRKSGQREPNGRLKRTPTRDTGTAEALIRRIALVGPNGDPTRAHFPLGVALERGVVTQEQYAAGIKYARAFSVAIKRPLALGAPATHPEASEALRIELTMAWRAYSEALCAISRGTKDVVDAIVLYQRWPRWLMVSPSAPQSSSRRRKQLKDGLNAIARTTPPQPSRKQLLKAG